jgi:hypothetical protein
VPEPSADNDYSSPSIAQPEDGGSVTILMMEKLKIIFLETIWV